MSAAFEKKTRAEAKKQNFYRRPTHIGGAQLWVLSKVKEYERRFGKKPTVAKSKSWVRLAFGKPIPKTKKRTGLKKVLHDTKAISKIILPKASQFLGEIPVIGAPAKKVLKQAEKVAIKQGFGQKGQGKGKKTNPWLVHVKAFRKKNPGMKYSEVLKRAAKTYKK